MSLRGTNQHGGFGFCREAEKPFGVAPQPFPVCGEACRQPIPVPQKQLHAKALFQILDARGASDCTRFSCLAAWVMLPRSATDLKNSRDSRSSFLIL